ncbi:Gfo/Idh/MocA family protein [Frigidibacter sp. ROC022]|uniref:Gfo/Idh/MocA family protein n=1 Tax=Frigidibacter sp. ROC022 TaxID=2971796 RepID=UPI00215A89E6|nr:Gfo/Idh/MocA family oxidoreductase [Frigidibacter sp. ROC022]MCR8723976.1 Gfo/Idh/MocA family oxidoreductase [Frigidibacter sp. ROC022]
MVRPIRMMILGTGHMANAHADAYAAMEGVTLVAGVDTQPEGLALFAEKYDIEKRFLSLDEAIAWGEFDAVSNVTPDPVHYSTTLALLAAGKHVLCEKPLSTDFARAREMADLAARMGVVNVVNLTYRNVPALQKAAQMVAEGAIGTIRHLEASYLQSWLTQPAWGEWTTEPRWLWRLSKAHGSKGVLGDVGIHILDFATFVAGEPVTDLSCRLKTYQKAPGDRIGDYVLDANDGFTMHIGLKGGAIGTVSASRMTTGHFNDLRLRLYGDKGGLEVLFEKRVSALRACLGQNVLTEIWQEIEAPEVTSNYQRFIDEIRGEAALAPGFARGAELQQWLDLAEASDAESSRTMAVVA